MKGFVRKAAAMSVAAVVAGTSLVATSVPSQAGGLVRYGYGHHHHRVWPGAVAAGVAGTVALGVLAASAGRSYVAADDNGECYSVRRRFVDEDGYTIIRRVPVCD